MLSSKRTRNNHHQNCLSRLREVVSRFFPHFTPSNMDSFFSSMTPWFGAVCTHIVGICWDFFHGTTQKVYGGAKMWKLRCDVLSWGIHRSFWTGCEELRPGTPVMVKATAVKATATATATAAAAACSCFCSYYYCYYYYYYDYYYDYDYDYYYYYYYYY